MQYQLNDDTIVALATPPGVGAIAVIRLSGPSAIDMLAMAFRGKDVRQAAGNTMHVGYLHHQGKDIDEVVASIYRAPRSYTKENVVEISCHGSPFVYGSIIRLFISLGARMAGPGEFTFRAFMAGRFDLSQAEAVADLIAADSEAGRQNALMQLKGGFSKQLKSLRAELIHFASLLELELDFAEEDVEFADRSQMLGLIAQMETVIDPLIDSFKQGNVIRNGVATVIAGKPNAGKSTLLNALVKDERAIVSDIPGTTRDVIEESLFISGIRFRLMDTAGLREAADAIEAIGVNKSLQKIREAALVLYVFDLSSDDLGLVQEEIGALPMNDIPLLI